MSGLDLGALGRFLAAAGVCAGPLSVRSIGDGHSNLTYLVSATDRQVVVRRPPPPPVPPGAHDVLREARFLRALEDTDVPVPRVLVTAEAGEVLDVALYVMTYVEGPVVTTRTPEALAGQRRQIGESLIDTLAALHAVDWQARGLAEMGRPGGFNQRHLHRIQKLRTAAEQLPGASPRDQASTDRFAAVEAWLQDHVPAESGAAIVHSDFRIGNVVLAPDPPGRVAAVLDWELATIGDPLHDVAYFLAGYPPPDEPLVPTAALGAALLEPGYPSRAELTARYAAATGRDLTGLAWYTSFALWKLAVLYEYSRRRAVDPYYADPALVDSFLEAAGSAAGVVTISA